MAKKQTKKSVETLTHEDASRKNIPTAEYHSVMQKDDQNPVRVAYERRNRALDPQLVWRGKDEQDWSDLVVHAPPLYIQEKVHPKVLIDDLLRHTGADEAASDPQVDLFADFNGVLDEGAKTEFYQHDANWTNRMILRKIRFSSLRPSIPCGRRNFEETRKQLRFWARSHGPLCLLASSASMARVESLTWTASQFSRPTPDLRSSSRQPPALTSTLTWFVKGGC